jgi:hypothetical protein
MDDSVLVLESFGRCISFRVTETAASDEHAAVDIRAGVAAWRSIISAPLIHE